MKLVHIGDSLAIPAFFLLSEYFYLKENKSILEYFLFLFALIGLAVDSIFTYLYAPEMLGFVCVLLVLVLILKSYLL
jgi:hypothetical protein